VTFHVYIDPQPEWMNHAECAGLDVDLFFPPRGGNVGAAKKVCFQCPVREECLEHAMVNGEKWGVRGGMSEQERRRLRHSRRINGIGAA
jgi:WhiB family redox-sensing transcriptional regulator